jgi:hypothetical protein
MFHRISALLLTVCLLLALTGCGGGEESTVLPEQQCASAEEASEVVGFSVTVPPLDGLETESCQVLQGTLVQATYRYGDSTITVALSTTEEDYAAISTMEGAKRVGGVQFQNSAFSKLDVYSVEDTYFCAFTCEGTADTLYCAITQTNTDFAAFDQTLEAFVGQIAVEHLNQPEEESTPVA